MSVLGAFGLTLTKMRPNAYATSVFTTHTFRGYSTRSHLITNLPNESTLISRPSLEIRRWDSHWATLHTYISTRRVRITSTFITCLIEIQKDSRQIISLLPFHFLFSKTAHFPLTHALNLGVHYILERLLFLDNLLSSQLLIPTILFINQSKASMITKAAQYSGLSNTPLSMLLNVFWALDSASRLV